MCGLAPDFGQGLRDFLWPNLLKLTFGSVSCLVLVYSYSIEHSLQIDLKSPKVMLLEPESELKIILYLIVKLIDIIIKKSIKKYVIEIT